MAAQHECRDVFNRNVEFFREEITEAGAVENASHADNLVRRKAGELLQRPDHGVQRVGDADDESFRSIFLDARANLFHHLEVDAQKVVAAHARLARHACGHDDNVCAFDCCVVVGAGIFRIKTVNRRRFGNIQSLTLRGAFRNVEKDDVAEFLQTSQMGERAADHAGADEGNLVACHDCFFPHF